MTWESEFKLEKKHRPCLCGICHKQISTKKPRINLTVESGHSVYTYNKFYHIDCIIKELGKELKILGKEKINIKMQILNEVNKLIEEI